VEVEVS